MKYIIIFLILSSAFINSGSEQKIDLKSFFTPTPKLKSGLVKKFKVTSPSTVYYIYDSFELRNDTITVSRYNEQNELIKKSLFILKENVPVGIEKHLVNSQTQEYLVLRASEKMVYPNLPLNENQSHFRMQGETENGTQIIEEGTILLNQPEPRDFIWFTIETTQKITSQFGVEKSTTKGMLRFTKSKGWDLGKFEVEGSLIKYELEKIMTPSEFKTEVNKRN